MRRGFSAAGTRPNYGRALAGELFGKKLARFKFVAYARGHVLGPWR